MSIDSGSNNRSWFIAGRIIEYITLNRDKKVLQYGIAHNENVFEICDIVRQYTDRHIKLVPLKHGFSMYLTSEECK